MAATRPHGVGPVVARSMTRRRPTRDLSSRNRSRCCPPRDPSSRDLNRRRTISAVVTRATPVVARPCTRRQALRTRRCLFFFKLPYPSSRDADLSSRDADPLSRAASRRRALRTRRWALHTCRRAVQTCRRDPSRTRIAPVCASPISTRAFYYFAALCQSIPACTCHGDCLQDSLKGASHFSSHVIHHD